MSKGKHGSIQVDLTRTLELLNEYATEALCPATFKTVRTNERRRLWGVFRRNRRMRLRCLGRKPLGKRRYKGGLLTE